MTLKNTPLFRFIKLVSSLFLQVYYFLYKTQHLWRLEQKVKQANRLSKLENRRYIVTNINGKPRCIAKKTMKEAVKRRRFRKGVTIQDIELHAYYITK
jgi:hypothetical protein